MTKTKTRTYAEKIREELKGQKVVTIGQLRSIAHKITGSMDKSFITRLLNGMTDSGLLTQHEQPGHYEVDYDV